MEHKHKTIKFPDGEYALVEIRRLEALENTIKVAQAFGINEKSTISLLGVFLSFRARRGMSHVDINKISRVSRVTLQKIENGTKLSINGTTAAKLNRAFGDSFGTLIKDLGFVKGDLPNI